MSLKALAGAASLLVLAASCAHAQGAPQTIDVSHVAATNTKSDLPPRWNKDAAFMEIFVRSYKDSDGDGIGDFKGLTSQLDYLQSLGITGIWLMPMMPSHDHDHGYAVDDYRAVEPDYGTMADFEEFVREAHKRGIGVILDFVCNHSGSGNAIFENAASSKASPYRNWYVFNDKNPGWYSEKMRGVSGAYWTDPWKHADKEVPGGQGYYYAVFSDSMPDWNLRNPDVVTYLQDTMRFWMNKGVDGFRLDAVTMLLEDGPKSYFNNPGNPAIVMKLRQTLDEYDNRYLICEVSEGASLFTKACNAFAYGTQGSIIDGAKKGTVQDGLITQLQTPDRPVMPLALQSHDAYVGDRLMNQFGVNGLADYRMAAAVSILASDTPFSYYGEEIGMSNSGVYNDPGLRAPMSWTGVHQTAGFTTGQPYREPALNVATMNVAAEAGDPSSLLEYYRALYTVRRDHPVLGYGKMTLQSKSGDPALVFTRADGADLAAVVINMSDTAQTVSIDTGVSDAAFAPSLRALGDGVGTPMHSGADGRLTVEVAAKSAQVWMKQ